MSESIILLILPFLLMIGGMAMVWSRAPRARKAFRAGIEALQNENWPEAETQLKRAVKLQPIAAVGHRLLGRALTEEGKHDEAEKHFRMAAALEPRNPEGYADLGFFLAVRVPNRHEDAITAFSKAVELAPRFREQLAGLEQLAPLRAHEAFRRLLEPQ